MATYHPLTYTQVQIGCPPCRLPMTHNEHPPAGTWLTDPAASHDRFDRTLFDLAPPRSRRCLATLESPRAAVFFRLFALPHKHKAPQTTVRRPRYPPPPRSPPATFARLAPARATAHTARCAECSLRCTGAGRACALPSADRELTSACACAGTDAEDVRQDWQGLEGPAQQGARNPAPLER